MTRFGVAVDQMARLAEDGAPLIRHATRLGYESAWTPAPAVLERDAFQICLRWWEASTKERAEGIRVGIAVVPLPWWSVPALAVAAATLAATTGGRFVLGVGPSALHIPSFRGRYGLAKVSPMTLVREALETLLPLLNGERVTYEGALVQLTDVSVEFPAPATPVYMSALGPRMLALAGECADGVNLNWCTSEKIAECRTAVDNAAVDAGRAAGDVVLSQSIRVSIDRDVDVARRRLARAILHYALARPGSSTRTGYRGHFGRMGFDLELRRLEAMREAGATEDALADAFPVEILSRLAYFGNADGAAGGVAPLARGLDLALIRPVVDPGDADAVAETFAACVPLLST